MDNAIAALLARMAEFDLHPGKIRWDTSPKFMRFDTPQDTKGERSGFYVAFSGPHIPGAHFGDHRRGIKEDWCHKNGAMPDDFDKAAFAQMQRDRKVEMQRVQQLQWEEAAKKATGMWAAAAAPSEDHPYLQRKGITNARGLRQEGDKLLVPMCGLEPGERVLCSVQTIDFDGKKMFMKGGRAHGTRMTVGQEDLKTGDDGQPLPGQTLYITEGWATAWTVHLVTGCCCVVAFSRGNLSIVAETLANRYPQLALVICADNDRWTEGNPGVTDAEAAAKAIGARVAIPDFMDLEGRPTDFNDLFLLDGADAARQWLDPERASEAVTLVEHSPDSQALGQDDGPHVAGEPPIDESTEGITAAFDWERPLLEAVNELNERYFVAEMQGAVVIASEVNDPELGRTRLVFSKPADIKLKYAPRHYVVGHGRKEAEIWSSLGEAWLSHRRRRSYDRIALIPSGPVPPDTYNLWRGFGVDPIPGDWPLIRSHLLDVICSGDLDAFEWLVSWMARCVQRPERRAEVAIVLRGLKGAGKGAFAQILLAIFRDHALSISSARHLVGNFNAHLVDVLLLFLDEAFWAGDKTGEGTLKALITEPTMMIEPKGVNAFPVPNRLKVVIASNADWVVPATADERRYFVLDVCGKRRGAAAYFTDLFEAIGGAETPAFLAHLQSMDLSSFDHRNAPHTDALNQQKLVGGDSLIKFWRDCLETGEIIMLSRPIVETAEVGRNEGWPPDIVIQELHRRYVEHAQKHGDWHPLPAAQMGKKLRDLIPALKIARPCQPWGDQAKPTRYLLPVLVTCRDGFLAAMNIERYEWPEVEE